jgi:hypothetical protein
MPSKPATRSNGDQRAGAVVGEQFQQHRVRRLAVEDDDALDAALERVDAGLDLGDHAAGDGAVGDQRAHSATVSSLISCLVEHARHVGEEAAGAWPSARRRWRRRRCRR